MHKKARFCPMVASLSLCAAVTAGLVTMAGWGANAQELDWATSAGSSLLGRGQRHRGRLTGQQLRHWRF